MLLQVMISTHSLFRYHGNNISMETSCHRNCDLQDLSLYTESIGIRVRARKKRKKYMQNILYYSFKDILTVHQARIPLTIIYKKGSIG
ncbi:uncharacterized protein T551_02482 [Pneumocystis jirovecii RU7]|uniref:Uncharacterized protein n=1 Tax=Pneumocystis jirovecii (strain RU7) TaxID=1408657 RepID=A0A0W4ZJV6_PNEJ7|nr:uncharacterized protein T551_02482 [Pneumocystis jirovecii RU7]KTW28632.1 hypothetical protein T551_02482 [Pneumocystis jirovecii RU7]